MSAPDTQLNGLLIDRLRLQQQLAPVLRRVGPTHPDRAKINKKRAIQRKAVKKKLRVNANAIAARCMELFTP